MSPCERASAIAWITWGRSTDFSRCSSVFRRSAPSIVIGIRAMSVALVQSLMQRLDRIGNEPAHAGQADGSGTRAREGRIGRDLIVQCGATNHVAVVNRRTLLLDVIDYECDFVILHHV